MNTKLLAKSKTAVALFVAFFLGGVSARLWLEAPSAPLKDVQANQEKQEERGQEHQGERAAHEEEKLTLSAEAQREAGITLAEATGGELEQTLNLPGALTLNADTVLHIVPRVAGIVQRVNKTLGDEVKPGEVLAVIESRELAETKAAYLAAKQRLALAQATLASAEELKAKRILPGLEYLATKREFANAEIELQTVTHKLHALGLTAAEIAALSRAQDNSASFAVYELRAPAAGTIIEKHITLGEVVENNSDVFVMANLSTIWANVTVYAQDTPRINVGQTVHLSAEGFSPETTGKIAYISPLVDEATRTATARVLVLNPDKRWKPGVFVTARIVLAQESVRTLVPNDAIQTVNNTPIIFVPEDHAFEPRPVTVGRINSTHSQILAGLEPGDRYVMNGAFVLKAELGKGEGGHDH
ncbi:MAG: efflux RND transporter periplasmic adaptor subunit [Deltaproteobacteria bacterium]|nr:efflux RND transporter periplasmic adaptor subunit [Deltaproteobacteria bacterium]